jgi:uncharacterized membrane protein YidH (DUF202 family)
MVLTEMAMICPKCGSEYFSTSPTCYACSELMMGQSGKRRLGIRRAATLAVGVILLSIGILLIFLVAGLVHEYAETGVALFGVFLTSVGAGVVSYSLLNIETTLKQFREGSEPSNRLAAGFTAFGFCMLVCATFYVIAAYRVGFSDVPYESLGILIPVSMALIIAGLLRRPRILFKADDAEMDRSTRTIVGLAVLLTGFIVQVFTFVYGYLRSLEVLAVGWVWFFLVGPLFVIAGIAVLWGPMGRPWIPGGYKPSIPREKT